MKLIFYISILFILYVYAGYILILWILSLFLSKSPRKNDIIPFVSLIIPAYNEEDVIEKKIKNTLSLDYPRDKLEIIIASESTDGTNEIVKKFFAKGIILHSFKVREGKCANLFKTVPLANGEIIVFSDANAIYKQDALKKLLRSFADPRVGCVSGRLVYIDSDKNTAGQGEGLYWKYEMCIKRLESRLFSLLGANGSIFAIRKDLYFPLSRERGDDFELAVEICRKGFAAVLELEAVSYERTSVSVAGEYKRRTRIISWGFQSVLLLLKECIKDKKFLLIFQLITHRLFRWLIPLFLMSLFISSLFLKGFYRVIFLLQIVFYLLAVLGFLLDRCGKYIPKISKLLNISYYFCSANFAALVGGYRFLTNKQTCTWERVER